MTSFVPYFEREAPRSPKGRQEHGAYSTPPSRLGRRRAGFFLAALVLTALSLATPGRAAGQQEWTFTATGTVPGVPTPISFPVTVLSNGSFSTTLGPFPADDCPTTGYKIDIAGQMQSLSPTGEFVGTSSACTGVGPQKIKLLLNAVFPNATSGSAAGPLVITSVGVNVTFSAQCSKPSCPPPGPPAQVVQATAGAKQAAALGTVALTTTSVQTTNIGLRLAALRRGATGVSVSGVSLNIDGQSAPLSAVTSLIASLGQGGGASADRASTLGRLGVFVNGQGSFGGQDPTSREPGFDFYTAGMTAGVDYRLTDQLVLGAALGYLRTKSTFDASAGDSRINGYSVSAYGSYYLVEKLYLDGIATFGWNQYSNERSIANAFTANSSTDGTQVALSVSTGYDFNIGAFSFGPTARVNYVRVHIDGYREGGADLFNLSISSQTIESVTSAMGGEARYAVSTAWGVLTPQMSLEWEHEYKGDSRIITASVLADPTTSVAVRTNSPDRDYVNLGAGLSATFKGGVSAFAHYQAVLGRAHFTNHSFNTGVRFEF